MKYATSLIVTCLMTTPVFSQTVSPAILSGEAGLAVLLAKKPKTDMDVYAEKWAEAKNGSKVLVVGIGCEPPPGDWLSCRVASEKMGDFKDGTVLVARGDGRLLHVVAKLPAGATTLSVAQSLVAPQPQQINYGQPMYGPPPMMMGGFGGFMGGFGCGPSGCG